MLPVLDAVKIGPSREVPDTVQFDKKNKEKKNIKKTLM